MARSTPAQKPLGLASLICMVTISMRVARGMEQICLQVGSFQPTLQAFGGSVKHDPHYGSAQDLKERTCPRHAQSRSSELPQYSDALDVDDLDFEGQRLAGQWMVEVHGNLALVEGFHNPRQLGIGGVLEDHQQALGQLHAFELIARHDLHVLGIVLTEALLGSNLQTAFVAGLETIQLLLEAR